MIRFFFFDNMISNGIKYEIGKWYRLPLKYDDSKHKNINNLLLKYNNNFNFRLSTSDQPICSNIYEVNVNKKDNSFKILKEINYNQLFSDFKYIKYKYYNACLLVAIKKNDKEFLKYRKKETSISYENHKILDIMTNKELFDLYKICKKVTKLYILDKGIKEIILYHYYKNSDNLPLKLFPNIGYKGLSQIQNKYKDEILISDNEQFLNENLNNYKKIINLHYLSFKIFISIERKKDIDFLKDKELDSSKAELLVQHIYDLKYLKEIEQNKDSKISSIAKYSIIKNDLDKKNIGFVYYFQVDKSKIFKIAYSNFFNEIIINFFILSANKKKLNNTGFNFFLLDNENDLAIDFYIKWESKLNQKLNADEYVNLLNDIKQLQVKYNYLYDNDFCEFNYSEEDLKYLLKKEPKSNNI